MLKQPRQSRLSFDSQLELFSGLPCVSVSTSYSKASFAQKYNKNIIFMMDMIIIFIIFQYNIHFFYLILNLLHFISMFRYQNFVLTHTRTIYITFLCIYRDKIKALEVNYRWFTYLSEIQTANLTDIALCCLVRRCLLLPITHKVSCGNHGHGYSQPDLDRENQVNRRQVVYWLTFIKKQ